MHSTPTRPVRFLLTLGLAVALMASMPITAGATGQAPVMPLVGVAPVVARAVTTSFDSLTAAAARDTWTAQIAQEAFRRIQVAEALSRASAAFSPAPSNASPVPAAPNTPAPPKTAATPSAAAVQYAGRNHLWIPSLGISHAVAGFACTRSTPPGAGVYRWGCAGKNNAYLFGHAWSTFKPLHDAYVAHRLHTGMLAYYADGSGRVRTYKVTAIKVVTPDQTAWAIAPQAKLSMTLQTCVGSRSQYRLLVRLVAIN